MSASRIVSRKWRAGSLTRCATIWLTLLGMMPAAWNFAATNSTPAVVTPVFWAQDFVDSVGVNTHMLHPDSFYGAHFDLMQQKLLLARISHIRDGSLDQSGGLFSSADQSARYSALGKVGIRTLFLTRVGMSKEFIQGFPDRVSPAFEAWEFPNELNAQKIPWVATLQAWMPIFAQYVKSTSRTIYPIVGPALIDNGDSPYQQLGDQTANIDFGNIHKYYKTFNPGTSGYGGAGLPPCNAERYGSLSYVMCNVATATGTKPLMITEAGYGSDSVITRTVTPAIQAKYILRMLLLHRAAGIRRTYIYQLADYGIDPFSNFGLLTADGTEKPAFRELSYLLNELYDVVSVNAPANPSVAITGQTADVRSVAFAKSDGSYRLVVWLEKPSCDAKTGVIINVPSQQITVAAPTGSSVRRLLTFDDSGNMQTQPQSNSTNTIQVKVADNLTILDLAGGKTPSSPTSIRVSH